MKKLICIILTFILFFCGASFAYAADTVTYEVPDVYMKIDVPADWITFTTDIREDDPNLSVLGTDRSTLYSEMVMNNVYLDSIGPDGSEINVIMDSNIDTMKIKGLKYLSDEDFDDFMMALSMKISSKLVEHIKTTTYETEQAKYVVFDLKKISLDAFVDDIYITQYYTMMNGQIINIQLVYAGEMTSEYSDILKAVVDSIGFTKTDPEPSSDAWVPWVSIGIVGLIFFLYLSYRRKRSRDDEYDAADEGSKE